MSRPGPNTIIKLFLDEVAFAHADTTSGRILMDSDCGLRIADVIRYGKKLLLRQFEPVELDLKKLINQGGADQQELTLLLEKLRKQKYVH